MDQLFREQFRHIYQTAQHSYQSVVLSQTTTLEEQVLWDATLAQFTRPDEMLASLQFIEPPDHLTDNPVTTQAAFAPDSELRFFLDGAQRTYLLFVANTIPVCATVVSAALLERPQPGSSLQPWTANRPPHFALLLPDAPTALPLWEAAQAIGLPIVNTLSPQNLKRQGRTPDEVAASFDLSRYFAYERSRQLRRELERDLICTWLQSGSSGWLVTDGDIRHLGPEVAGAPIVGLIKHQRYEYFTGASRALLLGLPAFHRTNVFQFRREVQRGDQLNASFFLRWRPWSWHNRPEYGLLRIESPANLETEAANALGRWIVAEGRPAQFDRNGNHIYPIARAEHSAKQAVQTYWRRLPRRWAI